jgi:hypothetical protein
MKTKDIKEVKSILKDLKKVECKLPDKEKDILEWTMPELKAYIKKETKGMNIIKKIKFASALDKRIKKERKKYNEANNNKNL